MRTALGWTLEQYLHFGGYPGPAPLVGDPARWLRCIADSLIETSLARDVLLLSRVDKPALLRRWFEFACRYSGQSRWRRHLGGGSTKNLKARTEFFSLRGHCSIG